MPTYVTLAMWTERGVQTVKESPQRLESARQALSDMGDNLKDFYLVMGDYDMVFVSEAPDDETYARFLLSLCSRGDMRSTTMKAFTEEQTRAIIGALP
jgi:uncharacterized protein with GYD domain